LNNLFQKKNYRKVVQGLLTGCLYSGAALSASPGFEGISAICGDCKIEKYASCGDGKFLEGPVFNRDGELLMTGMNSGELLKVDKARQCTVSRPLPGKPTGLSILSDGNMLVTSRDLNVRILNLEADEDTVIRQKYGVENLRGINDNELDKNGGVYFTEPYGSSALNPIGRVFYLPAPISKDSKKELMVITKEIAYPNGVALSPDEKTLYVSDFAKNRIIGIPMSAPGVTDPNAFPYVFIQLIGGKGPDGITVDAHGNLYAAQYLGGQVAIIDKYGNPYGAIRLPEEAGVGTTNIAIHEGYLYITEAQKNEVWRVKLSGKNS
jgi:gluconolactonase